MEAPMIDVDKVEEPATTTTSQSFSLRNEPTLKYPYLFRRVFHCGHEDEIIKIDHQPGQILPDWEVIPRAEHERSTEAQSCRQIYTLERCIPCADQLREDLESQDESRGPKTRQLAAYQAQYLRSERGSDPVNGFERVLMRLRTNGDTEDDRNHRSHDQGFKTIDSWVEHSGDYPRPPVHSSDYSHWSIPSRPEEEEEVICAPAPDRSSSRYSDSFEPDGYTDAGPSLSRFSSFSSTSSQDGKARGFRARWKQATAQRDKHRVSHEEEESRPNIKEMLGRWKIGAKRDPSKPKRWSQEVTKRPWDIDVPLWNLEFPIKRSDAGKRGSGGSRKWPWRASDKSPSDVSHGSKRASRMTSNTNRVRRQSRLSAEFDVERVLLRGVSM
ncbi:hypothetical protein IQ07DRAFT_600253 [Pyrenochaeta sp. DS3sAY3a]|nr:hypothetical protein IQ07DRAFT_600253 [Pyrenochaeta sp. DS3sAY3a]